LNHIPAGVILSELKH